MLTIGPLNDLPSVRHGFFCRTGGVSEGLFTSLNCGYGSGDDKDKVTENRRRAMARMDLEGERLVTAYQVHSPDVVEARSVWAHADAPRADAMVTRERGLALGILTADCVPVLLADAEAGVVGAAHAGWKGALGGVIEAVVAAMAELGAAPGRIVAGIGPAISQRSYEVGPEFPAPFLEQDARNADFFCPGPREGHYHFDLKDYVARRLSLAGLATIQTLPCDTCAEDERFFSYRRACLRREPDYGRGLSAIYLEP
jgi:YfiH family protein